MERHAEGQEHDTADQFIEEHRRTVLAGRMGDADVQDGENGIDGCGKEPQGDAQAVSYVQTEDEEYACDGYETDQKILP